MEVLLAFITDDFHDSIWVNQEIGFALGRTADHPAEASETRSARIFSGDLQALKWKAFKRNITTSHKKIYNIP